MHEEVHGTLMSMKSSYKAPSRDGFQPIFYKMFWKKIGEDVCIFVCDAIALGTFDTKGTKMLLVSIPKVDSPATFKDFRPITLCNMLYKLISKVIVSGLRSLLDKL